MDKMTEKLQELHSLTIANEVKLLPRGAGLEFELNRSGDGGYPESLGIVELDRISSVDNAISILKKIS